MWPLVGRDEALGALSGLLERGGAVLEGEAGVGKSRLQAEVARVAAERGDAVEWVRATGSARSIPLGAFAGLLDAPARGADLLTRAHAALAERAAGRRLVLCVDDGHLLDEASAALTHQVVAVGEAAAVITVRRGEPVPDALRALWKDELCARLSIGALAHDDVARLLTAALGGPVDGRTLTALWSLTEGNVLFLRELVVYGRERGTLVEEGGLWRWHGDVAVGLRLAELVGARLDALGRDERAVLELVAVGAPLEAGLLHDAERAAVDALERHALVVVRAEDRRRVVDVAHPLHGETVRAGLSTLRLESLHRRLADAVDGFGARRRSDLLRVATWRLESGGPADLELYALAAGHALSALDWRAAERFAAAAIAAATPEGSAATRAAQAATLFDARLILGRALAGAGRADEAEQVLAPIEPAAPDDGRRAAAAIAIARNRFWALHDEEGAEAVLIGAERALADPGARAEVLAVRMRLVAAAGRPQEALAVLEPLLDDPAVPDPARLHGSVAAAEALLSRGDLAASVAAVDRFVPLARRHAGELPLIESILLSGKGIALRLRGELVAATDLGEETYRRTLAEMSPMGTAIESVAVGHAWLARGRVRTAARRCQEGVAILRDVDAVGMLPWALAGLAQAAAQAGEADLAAACVAEMECRPLGHRGFEVELGLARAWTAAASGELSRARAEAAVASDLARSRGQHAFLLRALHERVRLGDDAVAGELAALRVDGPFAAAAAAHARARTGADLLAVAEEFASRDGLLVAAEAATAAARAFAAEGRDASARSAAARAEAWLARCEEASTPGLSASGPAERLTDREREIATLAATGLSSREIADRLVVSVRTVDNHLARSYKKLGITSRDELAPLLENKI